MHASNPETIYSAGSGDWTQARLITVSGSARTVPMSHRDKRCSSVSTCCLKIESLFSSEESAIILFSNSWLISAFTRRIYKPFKRQLSAQQFDDNYCWSANYLRSSRRILRDTVCSLVCLFVSCITQNVMKRFWWYTVEVLGIFGYFVTAQRGTD